MKQSVQYKALATITFTSCILCAYAQSRTDITNGIDPLIKIVGFLFTIGGIFISYMQLRMALKMADLESKMKDALSSVEKDLRRIIKEENEKLDSKVQLSFKEVEVSIKDVEKRMVTRHDMQNYETNAALRHELVSKQMISLEKQLDTAAKIYKNDNNG
jgi:hypothetical protein